jgi:hypothetical protein
MPESMHRVVLVSVCCIGLFWNEGPSEPLQKCRNRKRRSRVMPVEIVEVAVEVSTVTGRTADARFETVRMVADGSPGRELRVRRDAGAPGQCAHHRARDHLGRGCRACGSLSRAIRGECGLRPIRRRMSSHRGARLAKIRCRVRRCMFSRRAVSETLRPHNS